MNEKPDSRPAILIADADGRPGPAWQAAMSEKEDDISDLAARKLDVIYGRKDGMALVMDIYSPISNANQRAIICLISGGYWSGPE